jgi:hypothetical protein
MNWETIHLDHIRPISSFDLDNDEELRLCCHYTNFQPLLAHDNLTKSSKFSISDLLDWLNIINIKTHHE